jgi:hypothetical protein
MLTRPGLAALAAACLVGVVGWPLLGVIGAAWLLELRTTDPLWWVVGVFLAQALYLQWRLTAQLWRRYLDPRR